MRYVHSQNYTALRTLTSTPHRYTCQTALQYCRNMSSPCRSGAHVRGQGTGPAKGPSRNRTEVSRRRHADAHAEGHPSARKTAPLASVSCSVFLHTHSPAGPWNYPPIEISVCYLMLPAHRQGHRPRSPTHPIPASENPTTTTYVEPRCDNVTFAAYALPCKD